MTVTIPGEPFWWAFWLAVGWTLGRFVIELLLGLLTRAWGKLTGATKRPS